MTCRTMGVRRAEIRAYRIDDAGRFIDHSEFEASDDNEALDVVRSSSEELSFQVWTGARLVGRVDNAARFDKAAASVSNGCEAGE
jgi:hypothetical protein